MSNTEMPIMEHLEELRRRIFHCIGAVAVGFLLCYAFSERLMAFVTSPLSKRLPGHGSLVMLSLPEGFLVHLKVAVVAGGILASPYIFFQIWKFIAPGLYENEQRMVIPFVGFSTLCFLTGTWFGFTVVFPFAFDFFLGYAVDNLSAQISISSYISFASQMLLVFGIVFEMPIICFFLGKMGLISAPGMREYRRVMIVIIFILSAVFTPPDIISQIALAIPLFLLYELSIFLVAYSARKEAEKGEQSPPGQE